MKEGFKGKYQCYCENDYGSSEVSDPAELIFLNSSSASKYESFFGALSKQLKLQVLFHFMISFINQN